MTEVASNMPEGSNITIHKGTKVELTIERSAHGGEGIALAEERVVFVPGTYPGDVVEATITQVKKKFARAELGTVVRASDLRTNNRCPAALHGAGCCDLGDIRPQEEAQFKANILQDQLQRLGKISDIPTIDVQTIGAPVGWRTRMRLGVDALGNAGFRRRNSHDIVTHYPCTQAVPGLLDGIVEAEGASTNFTFTPGSQIVVVMDDAGKRSVVETRKPSRGQRAESIQKILEGEGNVTQVVDNTEFSIATTAFWQAHKASAQHYASTIQRWIASMVQELSQDDCANSRIVGWDLYGGAGAFVPAILNGLGDHSVVHSVELSPEAAKTGKQALRNAYAAKRVVFHSALVERSIPGLPKPAIVVLDPPRVGAGQAVIDDIALASPEAVIHIGCDPATFARDMSYWQENGYVLARLQLVDAFPGTHHFETLGLLVRTKSHQS
ncbi:class I SAM-dependent RNA methyltransferase [Corynebacterium pseudotuberculosis]|uniref:class I SAM-dependent RNA methyltransferase n=1 Tax=Corynebacterium pseudotuberculosis TaxID=1719 RepID=UPI0001DD83A2|nr:TRAM domain-containing protein [Corynebacterium pseudotuberculosis]ADK28994.1 TRAM domain-containing protein [Corynebacterium pseudotuberculosis FRC41]AEX39690.1 RNA methyltransferase, TrmA family [Corynebacterium pseudotuberculosis 3/99-5]ALU19649.1 RNA methyltransferase [Corynebacterium pseudotuberculosis]AUZ43311.1 TrmA family RNA methyltransferase [Corynebacterium pseudotuberculosis]MEA1025410.1 TRAM domain-containing protein [Corynebacterium pseudotuberculosis]